MGPDISVGIVTRYGIEGPGIESLWGRDILHPFRPALGPTRPPVQWVQGVEIQGIKWPGRGVDPHHPSSHEEEGRKEIYFCLSGPLWPVLERILPLTLSVLQRGTLIFITDRRI